MTARQHCHPHWPQYWMPPDQLAMVQRDLLADQQWHHMTLVGRDGLYRLWDNGRLIEAPPALAGPPPWRWWPELTGPDWAHEYTRQDTLPGSLKPR